MLVLGLGRHRALGGALARAPGRARPRRRHAARAAAAQMLAGAARRAAAHAAPFRDALLRRRRSRSAISPGMPLASRVVRARARSAACRSSATSSSSRKLARRTVREPKVLAITGTNGKSTVTALAGDMLRSRRLARGRGRQHRPAGAGRARRSRRRRAAAGRVRARALELPARDHLESLAPDAAAMLNVTEDHLDRYDGIDDYARRQGAHLPRRRRAGAQPRRRAGARAWRCRAASVSTFGLGCAGGEHEWGIDAGGCSSCAATQALHRARGELPIAGLHNAANALAALRSARALGAAARAPLAALREFKGLAAPRWSWSRERDGVRSTTIPRAPTSAPPSRRCSGMARAGGADRRRRRQGTGFRAARARRWRRCARAVVLIGRDAPRDRAARLPAAACRSQRADMEEAVRCALRARAAGRRGAALAGVRELRHVPRLRAPRRRVRRGGAGAARR